MCSLRISNRPSPSRWPSDHLRILPIFSAWSPARSMSFETPFDALANCALASPTDFASDLGSTLGRCFGIGTPSTVLRRVRAFSAIPPATPAAAPTASAGRLAFVAACLIESTRPCPLPAPLLLLVARAGALDRLTAALRFAPFEDAFARPFEDDFARPFDEAGFFARPCDVAGFFARLSDEADFFAADEPLVVRDALALRVLAVLLPVPVPFAFAELLVPPVFEAVLRFEPELLGLVSVILALLPSCHLRTTPNPGSPASRTSRVGVGVVTAGRAKGDHKSGDVMADTPTRDAKLVQFLNEAYAKEKQLETSLEAHAEVTTHDGYAKRLKDHRKETKSHATQLSRRIKQLGGTPETVSMPGPDGVGKLAQNVAGKVEQAKAAVQGPLHNVRGEGEQEKMLHNARVEVADEAQEIATYTVIDALATAAGDKQTAKLARDIQRDEERMHKFLSDLLPELSAAVAHDEIPISEIEAPAGKATAKS